MVTYKYVADYFMQLSLYAGTLLPVYGSNTLTNYTIRYVQIAIAMYVYIIMLILL